MQGLLERALSVPSGARSALRIFLSPMRSAGCSRYRPSEMYVEAHSPIFFEMKELVYAFR